MFAPAPAGRSETAWAAPVGGQAAITASGVPPAAQAGGRASPGPGAASGRATDGAAAGKAPHRARKPRPAPGGDPLPRRLGRALLDLVTGAAAARELADLAADAQLPVTTGRRIAVVSTTRGRGPHERRRRARLRLRRPAGRPHPRRRRGPGGRLARLAARRAAASGDPTALGHRLLAARGGTFADVEAVLPATAMGLRVLPGGAAVPAELTRALSRYFAITVVDGARTPSPDAHVAVLVTPTTPDGLRSTCAALDAWTGGPVVVALVDRDRARLDPDPALGRYGVPVVVLPYDRHLAAGAPIRPDRLRAATHREATRLAGLALAAAIRSGR